MMSEPFDAEAETLSIADPAMRSIMRAFLESHNHMWHQPPWWRRLLP